MFSKEEYDIWKIQMQAHLANTAIAISDGSPQCTEKPRAFPGSIHNIITGTQENGDRPAEVPVCPSWLPDDHAKGQHRPKQHKSRKRNTRSNLSPSAITARWSSDTTNQSVTTTMIALDLSATTHLSAGHNVALSQMLTKAQIVPLPSNSTSTDLTQARQLQFDQLVSSLVSKTTAGTTSRVQKNQRTLGSDLSKSFERTDSSRFSSDVESGFLTGINRLA
ncbi:hypothetical protein F511_41670 [Dorcoceras hygrometricum]|uniref:Uncharacterized protein n=1 Tax=Dorcoceras hygrometricum TaxID=472368 RepID=A0A2Z7A718_9LAMI|nr:hypothetical protein F511_41670 [Dorcoceras hygrometricum]